MSVLSLAEVDRTVAAGPFAADWGSLVGVPVPRWYKDGKFGIFIHWGVYSVPAFGSEWYPRMMYQSGSAEYEHHRATYGPQDAFGYKDFIPRFTAERFDPAAWAALFRASGARFVVPVAEHHDGFAMYPTARSRWNALAMGPRRDVIGDLASAVRREGLVFGASSHRAEHAWFFDGGLSIPSDVTDPAFADLYGPVHPGIRDHHDRFGPGPSEEFLEDWLLRTCELVDRYRPQLVWFDWWIVHSAFAPYLQRFAAFYYNRADTWGVGVAINYKYGAMANDSAVYDVERALLNRSSPRFWQCDTSVATNSWGYTHQQQYKQAGDLVHDLVDTVSKNGALLLNIGPRADGSIPDAEQELLRSIGAWLAINGEAIYGTRPWVVFGEGPSCLPKESGQTLAGLPKLADDAAYDHLRSAYGGLDIRFTTSGDALYAILLGRPEGGRVRIRSLGSHLPMFAQQISRVELLGHGPVPCERLPDALQVQLPEVDTLRHAWVLRVS